jgi:hypothetical protein
MDPDSAGVRPALKKALQVLDLFGVAFTFAKNGLRDKIIYVPDQSRARLMASSATRWGLRRIDPVGFRR